MNKRELVIMIFKTGLSTVFFVVGVYLMILSKDRWNRFINFILRMRDLQTSATSLMVIRGVGVVFFIASIFLVYRFFIYDPAAALSDPLFDSL